VICCGPRWSAF